jgi:hypothetical protein
MENATLLSDLGILLKTATSWMEEPHHPVLARIAREAMLMRQDAPAVQTTPDS